jgi:O-antigen/teichoic acid export membrane protein
MPDFRPQFRRFDNLNFYNGLLEKQMTLQVPTPNGMKQQEDVLAYSLFDLEQDGVMTLSLLALEQRKQALFESSEEDWTLLIPSREEQSTVISSRQEQPATLMKSEISGAASNAAIVGLGNIIGYLFKYGNNFVIQRALGAGYFGLYSISLSLVTLVASLFDLGLDNAMIRYIAIYRGKHETNLLRNLVIFCTAMVGVTGLLGALLVLFFAPSLATLVHKPDTTPLLQIMAPLVPLLCMQTVWTGGLQGLKEFKKRVLVQRFWVPLVVFLLMALALVFFRNVTGVTVSALIGACISTVISLYFLFGAISHMGRPGHGKYEVRTWLGFAIPNFMTTVVNTVLDSIDTLLLAFFVSVVAIGQYTAAIKISGFILLPMTSLNVVFTPTIAELYAKGEHQRLGAMFKLVTKWTIILCLPIFAIATLFSVPLLELSGSSFVAAWPLLVVLSLGNMIGAATGTVGYMLLMTGHQKFSFFNSIATVILNIVLGLILTPRYGAMGTAISTAFAIVVINLIRLVEVYVLLKIHPYRWDTLKPLGAGLISALLTGSLLYLLNLTHFTIQLFRIHLSIQLALVPVFLISYTLLLSLFKISSEDKIVLDRISGKFGRGKNQVMNREV